MKGTGEVRGERDLWAVGCGGGVGCFCERLEGEEGASGGLSAPDLEQTARRRLPAKPRGADGLNLGQEAWAGAEKSPAPTAGLWLFQGGTQCRSYRRCSPGITVTLLAYGELVMAMGSDTTSKGSTLSRFKCQASELLLHLALLQGDLSFLSI
jgi:hypothetical protein